MKKCISILLVLVTSVTVFAQAPEITLKNDRIGVNIELPTKQFHIEGYPSVSTNVFYSKVNYVGGLDVRAVEGHSITSTGYGIGGYFTGGFRGVSAVGVGEDYDGGFPVYGVYATATGTTGTRIGLHAQATGGATNLAAEFGPGGVQIDEDLSVDGKIKIGNDNSPASEGAIRYDNSGKDFEGYDGSNWNSFTSSGPLPSGAISCAGSVTINTDGTYYDVTMKEMAVHSNSFITVPSGKYFIVTGVNFIGPANGAVQDKNYTIRIVGSNDYSNEVIWIQGRHVDGLQSNFTNGFAPLIILIPGEKVRVQHLNYVDDNATVKVFVRGWLVDDLDF